MNFLTKISMFVSKLMASGDASPLLGDTVKLEPGCGCGDSTMGVIGEFFLDFLFDLFYAVIAFVLNIIDIIQMAIYKIMGIGVSSKDYVVVDPNNPILKFFSNDVINKAFSALVIIAVVAIIVYTIFAIVISEWKAASTGAENNKTRILGRTLRSFLILTIFPMFLLFGILLTNSLLAGFNNVFAQSSGSNNTIGANLFVVSAEGGNKYRNYANEGVRVPILVDFDDPLNSGSIKSYTAEELLSRYDYFQARGEDLFIDFSYNSFDKFDKSVIYKNNVLYNTSTYAGFEKFVTTPEQYHVMADFLEYALTNNVEFAIKNIRDDDIEWKYVDETIFDRKNTTLTITYRDANNLNEGNPYTVEYTPSSTDISTPISDAFDTISNILAIGDYEDNLFNIMSRDENSINVVYWETDKVHLKLSNDYKNNPTYVDKILLYEFNRYKYNNTLDCSLDELEKGVFETLYKLEKRSWRADLQKYITTEILYCVNINNNLYQVYLPDEAHAVKDTFGDFAYEIIDPTSVNMEVCTNHIDHASLNIDYHEDGTECSDAACREAHYHKGGSLTGLEKCEDEEHYEEATCGISGCDKYHYYKSGDKYYICDSSCSHTMHYHHYFNNYPKCDGTGCDTHNHYHFDGSRFDICYDSCNDVHYHSDGNLCTTPNCPEDHYHLGEDCESPACLNFDNCVQSHYHADGSLCTIEGCTITYHRHFKGVCGLVHMHSSDDGQTWSSCPDYNTCTVQLHKHSHDWSCNDKNCVNNHYHAGHTYCTSYATCPETNHTHAPCDACREDHYYYIDPYYEKCDDGISACSGYHYHLNGDGKYIDCTNKECEKEHFHYIYPSTDNCVYLKELDISIRGHYHYDDTITFSDIKEFKLNGSYSNTVIINGIEVSEYAYYDDILTEVVKQVNWPQKLINDMQTIYDNINLNLLITTGDWLTQLSTIIGSSMENGWGENTDASNSQTFDTSIIHPLGLIFSELFLNEVAEDRTQYFGNYEFKSTLDEQEIRALLLAICGEDKYRQLSLQLEYYVDLFNIYMSPVLEDVAYYENLELTSGDLVSKELYTYKAYLCSLLMSATCVEYLFDSALAYVGASNFAYGLLENYDLIEKLEAYYSYHVDGNTMDENGNPIPVPDASIVNNINFYVNVTVSYDDYKQVNKNTLNIGEYIGDDFDTMMGYQDFKGAFDIKEYNYLEFYNTFKDLDSLFYSINEKPNYASYGDLYKNTKLNSEIRTQIENAFDFGEIYNYNTINGIMNSYLLKKAKIIVTPGDYTEVVSVVESTYKQFGELDTAYQKYLTSPDSKNVYNNLLFDMRVNKVDEENKDYEYVKSLRDYIFGSTKRWEYVQAADYEKGYGLRGQLNKLLKDADNLITSVGSFGSGLMGGFEEIYVTAKLETLDACLRDAKEEGYIDMELPNTKAHTVYKTLLKYAKQHSNRENDRIKLIEESKTSLFDYVQVLMDQANSTSTDSTYGYKQSTIVLENISMVLYNYFSVINASFDASKADEIFDNTTGAVSSLFIEKLGTTAGTDLISSIVAYIKYNNQSSQDWAKDFSNVLTSLQNISIEIDNYLRTLEKIDTLNKYYVPYAVTSYVSAHLNTEFDIVVNSKHYTVGGNMTPGKLAEYILGAEVLRESGFECSFVEDDYKGFVSYDEDDVGGLTVYDISEYMSFVREFLCGFGEGATQIYNNTNFLNLSGNGVDELVIAENDDLMKFALDFLTQNDYLPLDILCARFDIPVPEKNIDTGDNSLLSYVINGITYSKTDEDADGDGFKDHDLNKDDKFDDKDIYARVQMLVLDKYNTKTGDDLKDIYLNAFDYLFINETREEIKLDEMTLKDLRKYTIDFIIDYEKLDTESDEQNQKRYLALFNLACADWKQNTSVTKLEEIAAVMTNGVEGLEYSSKTDEEKEKILLAISDVLSDINYKDGNIEIVSPLDGKRYSATGKTEISTITSLTADNSSMAIVLKLAGIENRPYEELVGLEYSINFDFTQPDEANGDIFIICTYDEQKHYYVPFMMTNKKGVKLVGNQAAYGLAQVDEGGGEKYTWQSYYKYYNAVTDYYVGPNPAEPCFFPIIARGGFDINNRPTAIRQNGKNIEFYRDDVVIQSASELGLSAYYVSIEDVYARQGFIANIVNTITKWVSGKTLTEKLVESLPRLSVDFSMNVPYGVHTKVTEDITEGNVFMNFSFAGTSLAMETVYDSKEINIFLLFFAVVVTFSFIFKALWGVISRLLEIVVLTIVGPLAISSVALKGDSKDSSGNWVEDNNGIYEKWKSTLIDKVLLAFGYIFGLNIFFLLYPMVTSTELFSSTTAFAEIPFAGGIPLSIINSLSMLFMLIALVSAITYAPKILAKVMNFTEAFSYGEQAQNRVKNTIAEAKDFVSGQRAIDAVVDTAKTAKNFIPGIEFIEKGMEKIKDHKDKAKVAALKTAATAAGVKSSEAKAAIKAYADSMEKQRQAKKEFKKQQDEAREKRNEMRDKWEG